MEKKSQKDRAFKAVFSVIDEAILILSPDRRLTYINSSGRKLFDISEDITGSKFKEMNVLAGDSMERVMEILEDGFSGREKASEELEVHFRRGAVKRLSITSYLLNDEKGRISGLAVVIADITNRKRFEQSLIDSETWFRTVVESLQEGLGITDREETLIYANTALSRMLGYSKEELIGMNLSRFLTDEEFLKIKKRAKTRSKGLSEVYEATFFPKDGEPLEVMVSAAPWTGERGEFLGSIGLLLDITERKKTEKRLKDSEAKYRATVEQSADNVYIYDIAEGRIIDSNPTLQELLGYTSEELGGLQPSDFIGHSEENIGNQILKVIEKGKLMIGERTYVRKDGSTVEVEVSASHIKYRDRSMLCVVSRDITERKRARERLIDERNRAEFYLDLLAHDIGNLHHGILTGIDIVRMSADDPERVDRSLTLVRGLLLRSIKLVDNVMTFSSLRSIPLNLRPMDLGSLLERGLSSAVDAFPEKAVVQKTNGVGKRVMVMVEPLVQEAFFNIYHNALKYQKVEKTLLETDVELRGDGMARILISDGGPGIPDDRKDTIFDRFKEPTKRQHTGLGMAIVKALVERYGGAIEVKNRVPDDYKKGTIFIISLPLSKEPDDGTDILL